MLNVVHLQCESTLINHLGDVKYLCEINQESCNKMTSQYQFSNICLWVMLLQ